MTVTVNSVSLYQDKLKFDIDITEPEMCYLYISLRDGEQIPDGADASVLRGYATMNNLLLGTEEHTSFEYTIWCKRHNDRETIGLGNERGDVQDLTSNDTLTFYFYKAEVNTGYNLRYLNTSVTINDRYKLEPLSFSLSDNGTLTIKANNGEVSLLVANTIYWRTDNMLEGAIKLFTYDWTPSIDIENFSRELIGARTVTFYTKEDDFAVGALSVYDISEWLKEYQLVVPVASLGTPVLTYSASEGKLQWDEVEGASRYEVWKDGVKIADVPKNT